MGILFENSFQSNFRFINMIFFNCLVVFLVVLCFDNYYNNNILILIYNIIHYI